MSLILSGTDGLSDVDGSASTPAIRGTDTNTGIFFPAADTIAFAEGGAEVARLNSSGNLGVGTTSPNYRGQFTSTVTAGGGGWVLGVQETTREGGMVIGSYGNASARNGAIQGLWWGNAAGDLLLNPDGGNLLVGGTSTLGKTTIYWDSSAQQGITTRTSSTTFNGSPIQFLNSSGVASGYISQAASSVSYVTSSDYRLKENIVPMTGALSKVALLKPCTYTWKVDGSDGQGFIAHELQEVVPDCVTGEKDAVNEDGTIKPQGIDTSFLVATLTAAIQEQQAIITDLKSRIETLEAK